MTSVPRMRLIVGRPMQQWGWPKAAGAQYIARVPHRVLEKWVHEEAALTERDSAHVRNVRDRNELERQMLQLRRSTRASGSYEKVITDSERAGIDRLLSKVEAMLANPDTQRHVCQSTHLLQNALTTYLPVTKSVSHACRSVPPIVQHSKR